MNYKNVCKFQKVHEFNFLWQVQMMFAKSKNVCGFIEFWWILKKNDHQFKNNVHEFGIGSQIQKCSCIQKYFTSSENIR